MFGLMHLLAIFLLPRIGQNRKQLKQNLELPVILDVLAEAMMVALVGALRGAGDTHWTMIASVTFHWTFIPLLWVMFHVFNASAVMGWLALVILFLVFCVALYLRYRGGKWKKMRVIDVELPVMANPGY